MKVKDIRKLLRGIDGNAKLGFGNFSAYSVERFGETLNLYGGDLSIIKEEKSLTNDKIKKVVIWCDE